MAQAMEEVKDKISPEGNGSGMMSKDKLMPALATAAAAAAAGLVATKGPDLVKKLTGEANEEAEELGGKAAEGAKKQLGENGGLMGKAASKLMGGGGGGSQKGGKTRRLPIQRWTDVAVPVNKAYEAWTKWEEWPNFMHRVLEVSEEDDNKIHVSEKIWFWTREWDGEITEQRKNDRIAWKTESGMQHSGVVSFHKIDDNLTRVMVDMDFLPTGVVEKMASGMRFVKRAVQADLARFKAYVEMADAKGIEYRSVKDGDEDKKDRKEQKDPQGGQDGGEDEKSDDDRESDRRDRESRRKERQQTAA